MPFLKAPKLKNNTKPERLTGAAYFAKNAVSYACMVVGYDISDTILRLISVFLKITGPFVSMS